MELTLKDMQRALETVLAEWDEMGVVLSQNDRERVLRMEFDRILGKLRPEALN